MDTIRNPIYTEIQADGRIRKWKLIQMKATSLE